MRGYVDLVQDGSVEGWVVDDQHGRTNLQVRVYVNDAEVSLGYACLYRDDLAKSGVSDGWSAFVIPFSIQHHGNMPCQVRVIEVESGYELFPGPIAFTPSSYEDATQAKDGTIDLQVQALERINSVDRLNEKISDLLKLVGVAVDRSIALSEHRANALAEVKAAVERSGGLNGHLGHLIGIVKQKYEPISLGAHSAPTVSIVIPVHNKFELTYNCISSIFRYEPKATFEIVVVDDVSTDETLMAGLIFSGSVRVVRNDRNLGFVGSCNHGAQFARGDFILFLNNDTLVEEGWLDPLIDVFRDEKVGIAGSRLLFGDGTLQECGGIIWQDGSGWNWGRSQDKNNPKYRYLREVDYVSGAALMIPRTLFADLGGFDTYYSPAYYEDTDLCFRVRSRGLKVVVQPASTIIHLEGQSNGTDLNSGLKKYQKINHTKFVKRWRSVLRQHRPNAHQPEFEVERYVSKRAVFVDDSVPTPDQDAGSNASIEHIKSLQRLGFSVIFVPSDNMADIPPYTSALEALGVQCIYAPYFWSLEDFLRKNPLAIDLVYLHRFSNANRFIDLVRRFCPKAAVIYNVADLHSLRQEREVKLFAQVAPYKIDRPVSTHRELELICSADATIVHSSFEKDYVERVKPEANVHLVKWPFQVKNFQRTRFQARTNLGFIGGFRHTPNVDAAIWFCDFVMPAILSYMPDVVFKVAGSNMPPQLSELASANVEPMGFVEDLASFLQNLKVTVAPLRYGAGLKGKVLSSMAYGTPCVMSVVAAEGMDLPDELAQYVTDDPGEMASLICSLCENEHEWTSASDASRHFIESQFTTDVIDQALWQTIESAKDHVSRKTSINANDATKFLR